MFVRSFKRLTLITALLFSCYNTVSALTIKEATEKDCDADTLGSNVNAQPDCSQYGTIQYTEHPEQQQGSLKDGCEDQKSEENSSPFKLHLTYSSSKDSPVGGNSTQQEGGEEPNTPHITYFVSVEGPLGGNINLQNANEEVKNDILNHQIPLMNDIANVVINHCTGSNLEEIINSAIHVDNSSKSFTKRIFSKLLYLPNLGKNFVVSCVVNTASITKMILSKVLYLPIMATNTVVSGVTGLASNAFYRVRTYFMTHEEKLKELEKRQKELDTEIDNLARETFGGITDFSDSYKKSILEKLGMPINEENLQSLHDAIAPYTRNNNETDTELG